MHVRACVRTCVSACVCACACMHYVCVLKVGGGGREEVRGGVDGWGE